MSGRKRKSQWDCKEETEVPSEFSKHSAQHGREIHSSHPAKLSDLNSNNCPPWSYSETWQDNNDHGDFNEIPESTRTIRGTKGYSISTCFSGRGRQNHSPSQETSWSQVHRYQRSRSSSRSRGRAGSRSRSRDRDMNVDRDYTRSRGRGRDMDENRGYRGSRDRDRDMNEDRDYPRGRGRDMYDNRDYLGNSLMDRDLDGNRDYPGSRLRDRDVDEDRDYTRGRGRDRDTEKDSTRTRSTPFDNSRVDDGLGDRKSGSRVSSQLCRDFAVGSCRRGSQCRFLHEDDLTLRDGGEPARERAERWRDRQEASEASSDDIERLRYHPADKVSNYNRSSRSTSFDHDRRRQPHKNGNIPCKYFAMGRCNRDDCRFSHDNPEGGSVKGRLRYDRYPQHLDNENKYWNGPERGDRNGLSDANITIWGDSDVRTMNYTDRTTAKKQNYDIFDQNLNKETKSWNGPKWGDVTVVSDVASSGWVDSNAGSVDFSEPALGEKKTDESHGNNLDNVMWNATPNGSSIRNIETFVPTGGASSFGREAWNNAQGSHYEVVDGSMSSQTYEQIIEGEPTQQLINNVGHPVMSESFNDQSDSRRGNNDMLTDDSNALIVVSISGTTMQLDVPDRSSGQKSDSLGSLPFSFADTAQRNMIPLNPTNGHGIDLNGSDKQSLYLNPQNEPTTFSEEPTKKQVFESEEAQADCGIHQNDMSSYQITEITDLSASLNEILSKGQQLPELYAALNPNSNSSSLLTSLSNSAVVSPPIASTEAQPNPTTMFEEQHVRIADTVEPSKYDKRDNLYELGKADPLASVLSFSTVEPSKHVSDGKPYKLDKSAQSEYLLPLSNDGISEHGNNNKPYELQEPKLLHNILSSSTSDSGKDPKNSSPGKACQESPATKQLKPITNSESQQNISIKSEKSKVEEEIPSASANPEGGVREGNGVKDEKEMRVFKVALVEYVKEILKPTWKEGQMSREVHKTIVKKVVDKVSSTIQAAHVPKTQEKIDQYLAHSKSKLTKLVQAYIERLSKS